MTLIDDLKQAESKARQADATQCGACDFVNKQDDLDTKNALKDALAGTIGVRKLVEVLHPHGADFGRRTIERHRREEHRP